jgi:predicted transcriptional regulator
LHYERTRSTLRVTHSPKNQEETVARPKLPRPTDAELELLNVLWTRGPSTVREIHEDVSQRRETGYTTVLKMLQIMSAKGLVERDEVHRVHIYRPALAQEDTQRALVSDLLDRVFNGSAAKLVMHALASKKASDEDRVLIQKLLNDYEQEAR